LATIPIDHVDIDHGSINYSNIDHVDTDYDRDWSSSQLITLRLTTLWLTIYIATNHKWHLLKHRLFGYVANAHMSLQLPTQNDVLHGLIIFHAKRDSTYVSSFLVMESPQKEEFTASTHVFFNAKW